MPLAIECNVIISFAVGSSVLFLGNWLNRHLRFLRCLNIPEAVSGGMSAALLFNSIRAAGIVKLEFDPGARDLFLLCFFTCLGLRTRFRDLKSGGKLLYTVFVATAGFLLVQNMVGILIARLNGLPAVIGIFSGSMSLIGGHATVVALASAHARLPDMQGALEIGTACATAGLMMASLAGGAIGRILIPRLGLGGLGGSPDKSTSQTRQTFFAVYRFPGILVSLLAVSLCIPAGYGIYLKLGGSVMPMPLFVCCFAVAFLAAGVDSVVGQKRSILEKLPFVGVLSDFSLGIFMAMSLMDLQMERLVHLAGPMILMMGVQSLLVVVYAVGVLFRAAGKTYEAAVACVGFAGFSLGDCTTALAGMTTITRSYGKADQAFVVVPVVSAFLINIANILFFQFFLNWA